MPLATRINTRPFSKGPTDRGPLMTDILIRAGNVAVRATLLDTPTARKIRQALPIYARAQTWGEEVYFSVDISSPRSRTRKMSWTLAKSHSGQAAKPLPSASAVRLLPAPTKFALSARATSGPAHLTMCVPSLLSRPGMTSPSSPLIASRKTIPANAAAARQPADRVDFPLAALHIAAHARWHRDPPARRWATA